jgi:hypothetical protein
MLSTRTRQLNIFHILTLYSFTVQFNINFLLLQCLSSGLFPSGFPTKLVQIFRIFLRYILRGHMMK